MVKDLAAALVDLAQPIIQRLQLSLLEYSGNDHLRSQKRNGFFSKKN
jgi:hypothetical protein